MSAPENVRVTFDQVVSRQLQQMVETHFDFYKKVNDNPPLQTTLLDWLFGRYLGRRSDESLPTDLGENEGGDQDLDAIVSHGESARVEFKSTLRRNLHTGQNDPNMEHAVLKTMNAFMNSDGGTLIIGIDDEGIPLGTTLDAFPNEDKYSLHFWQRTRNAFGDAATAMVRADFEDLAEARVFVVRCVASSEPVYLQTKAKGEEFHIRTGPSSIPLGLSDAQTYIAKRFGS